MEMSSALSPIYEERLRLSREGKLHSFYPTLTSSPSPSPSPTRKTPRVLRQEYGSQSGAQLREQGAWVAVGGRLLAFRKMSARLIFADLYQDGERMQIVFNAAHTRDFDTIRSSLQRGDIVEVRGLLDRTSAGELSVRAHSLTVLAPCLVNFPDIHAPDMTEEHRSRQRHLDLLARPDGLGLFKLRSQIIALLRALLTSKGFLEVETPILSSKCGGANALPFTTHMKSLDLPLALRIAPELFLKQLIVAGFDRVFEVGKVFRNEGLDSTHNPEFTSLEMYQSFATVDDMIHLAEEICRELSKGIDGHQLDGRIDLSVPFNRIDIVSVLEDRLKTRFEFDDPCRVARQCVEILARHHIPYDASNQSASYLFDKLVGAFVEPLCEQPTLLLNHPVISSPLAASLPDRPHLAARFELFIAGREIMNGYTELNDPQEQRRRFKLQLLERNAGNEEAQLPDEDYCQALEVGMPPTGGCGIGIDRLVMLLAGKRHIRDVILFPLHRPKAQ